METRIENFWGECIDTQNKEIVANVFRQLGASTHSDGERQKEDFYATEPLATQLLLEKETFTQTCYEPCVDMGKGRLCRADN